MRPVRQQRVGRSYLDAVLRDAGRPYDFRGGLRRLLNIGAAPPVRAAYTYGALPFSLKYLQHSAYGYGGEWPVATAPAITVPGNRHTIPQRPSASVSQYDDDGRYQTEPDTVAVEARQNRPSAADGRTRPSTSGGPDYPINPPVPHAQPKTSNVQSPPPANKPDERISSERLRQGPPPLVTSKPIGGTRNSVQPAEDGIDSRAAANRDHGQGWNEALARGSESKQADKTSVNHVLGRLARQLEAHNFGEQRQDVDRQFSSDEPQSRLPEQVSQSGRRSSRDTAIPMQGHKRPPEPIAVDAAEFGDRITQPAPARAASFVHPKEPPAAIPSDTPLQEQLRLMNNLKKQAAAPRGEGGKAKPEASASVPVKAKKKPAEKKPQPVIRHTIVRRAAAPAFWERSYLSHAALRLYK